MFYDVGSECRMFQCLRDTQDVAKKIVVKVHMLLQTVDDGSIGSALTTQSSLCSHRIEIQMLPDRSRDLFDRSECRHTESRKRRKEYDTLLQFWHLQRHNVLNDTLLYCRLDFLFIIY